MDRDALIDFLAGKIELEFVRIRGAAPGADRQARLHRVDAYRTVLDLVDPVLAEHILARLLDAQTAGGAPLAVGPAPVVASGRPAARSASEARKAMRR